MAPRILSHRLRLIIDRRQLDLRQFPTARSFGRSFVRFYEGGALLYKIRANAARTAIRETAPRPLVFKTHNNASFAARFIGFINRIVGQPLPYTRERTTSGSSRVYRSLLRTMIRARDVVKGTPRARRTLSRVRYLSNLCAENSV